ncbi:MAG TPA: MBL fold metallo-hydrolase [Clostridiales bacterium]|nr:MBL fold metallo-hydrolase [Clostridiales bacterium]
MKLCSIASGSSGNCIYVGSNDTNILIDVGISKKRIEEGLKTIDIDPTTISAILITHEHTDHIAGLGVMSRKHNIPIYGTKETLDCVLGMAKLGKISNDLFNYIKPNESFNIQDIRINSFSIFHDASNPVGYTLEANDRKIGIATDLGKYDENIINQLKDSDILFIEANHDENMLLVGSYPYYLKQRILGELGHLSNEASADLISSLISDKYQYITLAHLSKENNYDKLAYETIFSQLTAMGCDFSKLCLNVAEKDFPSELVII